MPNRKFSMNCINDLGLILLQPMVVPPTDSGRAQNDRFVISDSLFANFLIIIYETKNSMRGFSKGVCMYKTSGICKQN